tara:strand:- start:35 stop:253 length:219 start_codon:yes stop_codon:yes gene_type:complete
MGSGCRPSDRQFEGAKPMMIYGPDDQKTKAIAAAFAKIAATPDITVQRIDEMEAADPNPDEGRIEVGKLKED